MLHSQGLLLHLFSGSTQGLLSHWVHSGASSQVEILHPRVLKHPQFRTWFVLGLQSYGGCSPDWDSGWPGEDSQGRGTSQYMATQFEWNNSNAFTHFTLIPVSMQEDQDILPKILPLAVFPPCFQSPAKQWASSCASAQTQHCHPVLVWDLSHPVPCLRKPARTQATLWDAELQNLQDPCVCPVREPC